MREKNKKRREKTAAKKSKLKPLKRGALGGLAFCLALGVLSEYENSGRKRKEKVFGFVEDEEESLRSAAENAAAPEFVKTIDSLDASGLVGIREFEIERMDGGVIKFCCGCESISGERHEWGFYYSPDNVPVVFPGEDDFYTEKICDNFWYYSVSE